MIPIISFVGRHNAGKTTVLTKLVAGLSQKDLKIAFIKHAHHVLTFGLTKDSELILEAGADFVVAISPYLGVQYSRYESEPEISHIIASVPPDTDIIIIEGYKKEALPKIEVLRQEIDPVPMLLPQTLALVSDFPLEAGPPVFQAHDTESLVNFVLQYAGLAQS